MHNIKPFIVAISLFAIACGGDDDGAEPVVDAGPALPKPDSIPTFASLNLYSADSPLNQKIGASPAIDSNSAALIGKFVSAGGLVIQLNEFSAPVYIADASTPRVDVPLACGGFWELGVTKLANMPIASFAEPAFDAEGASRPPSGCGEDADQDNHMVVLDLDKRCEYDFWQGRRENGQFVASWGDGISMDSNGILPGALTTRASGFAFLGGVVWPDELVSGAITHALVFSYPFTSDAGPVAPATDSDGITGDSTALPIGAHLQLDPALDLQSLGLTAAEMTIAMALQEYGMFLVDTGGDAGSGSSLYAIDPKSVKGDPYDGIFPAGAPFPALKGIPTDRFRVLAMGASDPSYSDNIAVPSNACATYQ